MTHVLRVQRSDDPAAFVLFHVQQNGTEPLDLRIVGTDGELPFITETKQRTVKSLRSSNNTAADNDDWASVLSAILLQHDASHTILKGLETVASVAGDQSTMTLSIRRNIDGITQRLGAVSLTRQDEEEIDIIQWAGLAAQNADKTRGRLVELNAVVSSQQDTIQQLTSQLDALVLAKKAHEEDMLKKFAALLNAKKLKIRDQQRLLAKARVDPKLAAHVKQTRSTGNSSSRSKRKADEDSDDDDDDDDKTNGVTPRGSDTDETADETDAGDFDPAPVPSQTSRRGASQSGANQTGISQANTSQAGSNNTGVTQAVNGSAADSQKHVQSKSEEPLVQQLPPRRELPFARRGTEPPSQPSVPPSAAAADDDTESDDEL